MKEDTMYEFWVSEFVREFRNTNPNKYPPNSTYSFYPKYYPNGEWLTEIHFFDQTQRWIGEEKFNYQTFIRNKKLEQIL